MSTPDAETLLSAGKTQLVASRYRLEKLLGSGASSEVWRALDERLGRTVAIKVLRPQVAVGATLKRVEQEARAIAQLRHPAVVEIYDIGTLDSGLPIIVMEYLVGLTLREVLDERGSLTAPEAVSFVLPVADGLAAAHERQIVHRDVKPDNVYACRLARGIVQPKILDFGVARVSAAQPQRLTMVGALIGTPSYMAPEQTAGALHVTGKSDVWSLGVMLYEAVTGVEPFRGATLEQLFESILTAPVPYPRDVPNFDGDLFGILAEALRKDPQQRPAAAELVESLAQWLHRHDELTDLSGRAVSSYLPAPPGPSASAPPSAAVVSPHP